MLNLKAIKLLFGFLFIFELEDAGYAKLFPLSLICNISIVVRPDPHASFAVACGLNILLFLYFDVLRIAFHVERNTLVTQYAIRNIFMERLLRSIKKISTLLCLLNLL